MRLYIHMYVSTYDTCVNGEREAGHQQTHMYVCIKIYACTYIHMVYYTEYLTNLDQ